MKRSLSFAGRGWGYAVGAALTVAILFLYMDGAFDRTLARWLDYQFKHYSQIPESDRILMVDINDYAVERVHKWPWPREYHARLIDTLSELGATAIVMDIVFTEPTPPRFEDPLLSADYDIDAPEVVYGEVYREDAIKDDDELATAIRKAGNVYLAMYYRGAAPDRSVRQLRQAADEFFRRDLHADIDTFREALPFDLGDELTDAYHRYRMRTLLREDFGRDRDELAKRLGESPELVETHMAPVKRLVAREVVEEILADHPEADFKEVHSLILPEADFDTQSSDREDILRAYRAIRGLNVVLSQNPLVPESMAGRIEQGLDVAAPLYKLAEHARGVGFVTSTLDRDGVLRRLPLVIDAHGHLVRQLGFAAVCDLIGADMERIEFQGDRLVLRNGDGQVLRNAPLDDRGRLMINWPAHTSGGGWEKSFDHLPVSRIMEIVANRANMAENDARYHVLRAQAVELASGDQEEQYARTLYAEYERDVRQCNHLLDEIRSFTHQDIDKRRAAEAELVELTASIELREAQALDFLRLLHEQIKGQNLQPSPEEREQFETVLRLAPKLLDDKWRGYQESINASLLRRNEELIRQLQPRVSGRVCFVGYTATAVADLVNSPVYQPMPGVLGHANVVNTFLQNQFVWTAPRWLNLLIIALGGGLVTVLTASRGPWFSLFSMVLLVALWLVASVVLFYVYTFYTSLLVSALAVFICWAFITLYRQLTEQRAKRQFSRALAQYTSPAVAARIVEDAEVRDLAPRPCEVTCFFSDLRGFTSISERLGAEETRTLLNPYLEVMSEVLITRQALINKFIGDGIFAFFNPPILACLQHARAACHAALDSLEALARLNAGTNGALPAVVREPLFMRIGLNTGLTFVGDYGSVNKLDYTCIGDAVNLAARLEAANKLFGTAILVSESTRQQAGSDFEYRTIGRIQVLGKKLAIDVFELLGRAGSVPDSARKYAARFEVAVSLFQRGEFAEAVIALQHCADLRSSDMAVGVYLHEIARLREHPPAADWAGQIELTSK
jgi:class 3 adenylate cyclase